LVNFQPFVIEKCGHSINDSPQFSLQDKIEFCQKVKWDFLYPIPLTPASNPNLNRNLTLTPNVPSPSVTNSQRLRLRLRTLSATPNLSLTLSPTRNS
jgi:hypothetical protein